MKGRAKKGGTVVRSRERSCWVTGGGLIGGRKLNGRWSVASQGNGIGVAIISASEGVLNERSEKKKIGGGETYSFFKRGGTAMPRLGTNRVAPWMTDILRAGKSLGKRERDGTSPAVSEGEGLIPTTGSV